MKGSEMGEYSRLSRWILVIVITALIRWGR